jgi:hypothetical protein
MPRYGGEVLSARLNRLPFPDGWFPSDRDAVEELSGDWVLEAVIVKGRRPTLISPLLIVLDGGQREVVVFGVQGDDLVLRERTLTKLARLDHPDLRSPRALQGVAPGDTVSVRVARRGPSACLSVAGEETCIMGFTPGRTWALLLYVEAPGERVRRLIDIVWIFTLFFPVGFFSTTRSRVFVNGLLLAGIMLSAILLTRLTPGPGTEALGGIAGVLAGWRCYLLPWSGLGAASRSPLARADNHDAPP